MSNQYKNSSHIKTEANKDTIDTTLPLYRCYNCEQIPIIYYETNKNDGEKGIGIVKYKCSTEKKTIEIDAEKFFEDLQRHNNRNFCSFCKGENKYNSFENYYFCKNCYSTICEKCEQRHKEKNKNHEII